MDGGAVKRVGALADAEEASTLFEGLRAQPGNLEEVAAAGEGAVLVAVGHDALGEGGADAGDAGEERRAGGVELHAHAVHAADDHLVELRGEQGLVDVVLVLPYADGGGGDFDEFGQGVLQTAADGDGPAHGQIEVGELLAGDVAGGVNRGAGLVDGDHDDVGVVRAFEELADEAFGLAAGGAVADGDGVGAVARDELHEFDGGGDVALRPLSGIDGEVFQELAGGVKGHDLTSGADAGVDTDDGPFAERRLQEQMAQILGEDLHGLAVGPLFQLDGHIQLDARREQAADAILRGGAEFTLPRAAFA